MHFSCDLFDSIRCNSSEIIVILKQSKMSRLVVRQPIMGHLKVLMPEGIRLAETAFQVAVVGLELINAERD